MWYLPVRGIPLWHSPTSALRLGSAKRVDRVDTDFFLCPFSAAEWHSTVAKLLDGVASLS